MQKITVSALKIDGVEMPVPAPEGVTISKEKIWSADHGITESGRQVGTLLGISIKVDIKWPHLTSAQVSRIDTMVNAARNRLMITDLTGKRLRLVCEFGTPKGTWFSWAPGLQYVTGYSVTATALIKPSTNGVGAGGSDASSCPYYHVDEIGFMDCGSDCPFFEVAKDGYLCLEPDLDEEAFFNEITAWW